TESPSHRFIGTNTRYLISEMGLPTRKEKDEKGEIWAYESVRTTKFSDRSVEKVTKLNEDGVPLKTQIRTYPGNEITRLHYTLFFIGSDGTIYDTSSGSRILER